MGITRRWRPSTDAAVTITEYGIFAGEAPATARPVHGIPPAAVGDQLQAIYDFTAAGS
jgi:hypothetical protein